MGAGKEYDMMIPENEEAYTKARDQYNPDTPESQLQRILEEMKDKGAEVHVDERNVIKKLIKVHYYSEFFKKMEQIELKESNIKIDMDWMDEPQEQPDQGIFEILEDEREPEIDPAEEISKLITEDTEEGECNRFC